MQKIGFIFSLLFLSAILALPSFLLSFPLGYMAPPPLSIYITFGIPALAFVAVFTIGIIFPPTRSETDPPFPNCPRCGYDCRANKYTCSECGIQLPKSWQFNE